MIHTYSFAGNSGWASIHTHFKLVIREHILSPLNWEHGARLQVAVWDPTWLQDGWLAYIIHQCSALLFTSCPNTLMT